jgi:hypothetical protein
MPYTANKPGRTPDPDELRARIPGWGADLDPADRPSVPKLQYPADTGAHWDFPERQQEKWPRERSIEHAFLTPVFGTAQPPTGLSGVVRKYAYARFSEGRLAHWLLLVAGDRIDAAEHRLRSFASTRPDVPATGVRSESTRGGLRSRRGRSDARHHLLDPVVVAGPWVAGAGAAVLGVRRLVRGARR